MKKPAALLLLMILVHVAAAQEAAPARPHLLKLNLSSFAAGNISLQYEHVLSRRSAAALGLRVMPRAGLPFRGTVEDLAADNNATAKELIHTSRLGGFAITPEFRYYFGPGHGRGFYLAPFLRYERFNITSDYAFTAPDNTYHQLRFQGADNVYGAGLMLGVQFRLKSWLYLDCWIAGPYYTHHSLALKATGFAISEEAAAILQDELDKTEVMHFDTEATARTTEAQLRIRGSLGAVRALGLCLAFRF